MQRVRYMSDQQVAEERCKMRRLFDGTVLRHAWVSENPYWCLLIRCRECGMIAVRRIARISYEGTISYEQYWQQIALPDGVLVPPDPNVVRRLWQALRGAWAARNRQRVV